jgi:hypothetical protein
MAGRHLVDAPQPAGSAHRGASSPSPERDPSFFRNVDLDVVIDPRVNKIAERSTERSLRQLVPVRC